MPGQLQQTRTGDVVVLTIDHAAKRNALDVILCEAIATGLTTAASAGARAVVLVGAGAKAFSAGFDLDALGPDGAQVAERAFGQLMASVAASPLPIVCGLNGAALGGGLELAAACDLRVAHAGVRLGLPPARLGIVYPERGLVRLSAIIGESRARQLFLAARTIEAETALAWGLVDEVTTEEEVLTRACAWAEEIAGLAPLAVQGMRRAFEALLARRTELDETARAELEERRRVAWQSIDAAEARAAFAAKRPPRFLGR